MIFDKALRSILYSELPILPKIDPQVFIELFLCFEFSVLMHIYCLMIGKVTLLVPWLERKDQDRTYPHNIRFEHPNEQKQFVRDWLIQEANLPAAGRMLDIRFYSGRYHDDFHSIFPMGDIAELIPDEEADICVLEEPEHLNWYRAPFKTKTWTEKFKHVVGIIHTNYLVYARSESGGFIKEPFLQLINQGMCRAYCHRIIKLSDALQNFAPDNFEQIGLYF